MNYITKVWQIGFLWFAKSLLRFSTKGWLNMRSGIHSLLFVFFVAVAESAAFVLDEYTCKDVEAVLISPSTLTAKRIALNYGYVIRGDSLFSAGSGVEFVDIIVPTDNGKYSVGHRTLSRLPGFDFSLVDVSGHNIIVAKLKCKQKLKW